MKNKKCMRCNKHIARIFPTNTENGVEIKEGLCIVCTAEMKIKPDEEIIKKMDLTDERLDKLYTEIVYLCENTVIMNSDGWCPMLSSSDNEGENLRKCKKNACAWWDSVSDCCIVFSIYKKL